MTTQHTSSPRALADKLAHDGKLRDPAWIKAFASIPRHLFLPHIYQPHPDGGFTLASTPEELAYQDEGWTTQINGTFPTPKDGEPIQGQPTSSSSAPGLMAVMLEALDVADGVRVLEVGTGTGYNAALLCHRLGDQHVVTVEVDPVLAEQAQQRLAEVGYRPIVHVGDGADGYPPGAPYDRVIVTCALTSLSWKLIEQTRQGGVLVVPVWRGHLPAGLMLRLTATGGSLARGQVLDAYGGFMPARNTPPADAVQLLHRHQAAADEGGTARTTSLTTGTSGEPWAWFAALVVPDAVSLGTIHDDGPPRHWLLTEDSWCYLTPDGRVVQGGRRHLWDEIEAAHSTWEQLGQPARHQCQVIIDPDGARLTYQGREWPILL